MLCSRCHVRTHTLYGCGFNKSFSPGPLHCFFRSSHRKPSGYPSISLSTCMLNFSHVSQIAFSMGAVALLPINTTLWPWSFSLLHVMAPSCGSLLWLNRWCEKRASGPSPYGFWIASLYTHIWTTCRFHLSYMPCSQAKWMISWCSCSDNGHMIL